MWKFIVHCYYWIRVVDFLVSSLPVLYIHSVPNNVKWATKNTKNWGLFQWKSRTKWLLHKSVFKKYNVFCSKFYSDWRNWRKHCVYLYDDKFYYGDIELTFCSGEIKNSCLVPACLGCPENVDRKLRWFVNVFDVLMMTTVLEMHSLHCVQLIKTVNV